MDFPVATIECIDNFFDNLPEVEKDQEITAELIQEQIKCTHRNATRLIRMLVLLDFIGKNSIPTDVWWRYYEHPQATLRTAIKELYGCLYKRYDDPYQESPKAIADALRSETKLSAGWGKYAARCFCALHEIANKNIVAASYEAVNDIGLKNGVTISIQGLPGAAAIDQDFITALRKYL